MMQPAPIETPSGKGSGDENFPVGSWLLPARLRPHVAAFYAYARAIDDIADDPHLEPADKIGRLDRFAAAVRGEETQDPALATAHRMAKSLGETGVTVQHCLDLIAAFKMDATKARYTDWADLMGYCELSANPVGRYLLDLHGEARTAYGAADGLCSALQVLNHLQDMGEDYAHLNRVYLPQDWLDEEGGDVKALTAPDMSPALRRVTGRCLDGVAGLLATARHLPEQLGSLGLAMESGASHRLATKLSARLERQDALAERVVPPRAVFLGHAMAGALGVLTRRLVRRPRGMQTVRLS